jgi:glucosylceramidase
VSALALTAAVGAAPPAEAQAQTPEVIFTGDFESGSVESWVSRGGVTLAASGAQASSGDYSLRTTGRTSGWNGPAHNMLDIVEPLGVYEFALDVRLLEGAADAPIQLTMQTTSENTGETTYSRIAGADTVTDDAWTTIAGEYTPPEPASQMQFYVESTDATVSYYIDAVAITMIQAPPDVELPAEEAAAIDFGADHQRIDGFGFSQTFGRAEVMRGSEGLTPEHQREVLDLLLDTETGAGLSILRLGVFGIQPEDPGGPDADPDYTWDGEDAGQVWLAREAQNYGVERFYADAWSAPGYMKTNGAEADGGELCGTPGTDCGGEDWRQAYADYLVQYAQFYADEGIDITDLGFANEPDFTATYDSMRFTDAQITDFVKIMGPAIEESGLDMNLVCCDSAGWNRQIQYTEAIEADPEADQWIDIHSGHSYVTSARSPLPTEDTTWMSEYALSSNAWNEAWDAGGSNSGLALANDIHDTLTRAEVNAYITWFGASLGTTAAPIQLDGADYHVSKRLWATAAYSRFIRPGAYRTEALTDAQLVKVSAYRNADGSRVVNLINNRDTAVSMDLALTGTQAGESITTYQTDEAHALEAIGQAELTGSRATVDLAPRSVTTLVIEADGDPEPDSCRARIDVVGDWGSGWYGKATVTAGDEPLDGWDLTWDWPGAQRVLGLWNAEWSQTGTTMTASDAGWNARIEANASRDAFGFIATGPAAPLEFAC